MQWKKILAVELMLLLILLSMSLVIVSAESDSGSESEILPTVQSTITTTPIKNEITPLEQASFSLKITNNAGQVQRYSIYSLQSGQGWNVDPSPLRDKIIEIGPKKSYTTKIIAYPIEKETLSPGIYYVHITIQSDLGEMATEALKIYLSPEKPIDYLPAIKATIDMNDKINPKEPVSIKLFLDNRNPLNLTDLKIRIESDIPEFVKEISVDLPPLEKKTIEFSVVPSQFQQPKEYTLFFVFEKNGETIKIIEKKIEIISLLPEFAVETAEEKSFLKRTITLTVKNGGNVLNTQTVKFPISFLGALITSSEGEVISDDEGRYIAWELALEPDETATLSLTTNYRILLYLLIAILLFGGFYLYVRSPVSVQKNAVTTQSGEGGALSEIKITLELNNHSKKTIKDVVVTDLVPGIGNVDKGLELGTLKPREIKYTKSGTKVIWSLAELEPDEHRLITYKMKAKLNILGIFSLPRAVVEFKKNKRKQKSYSNIFRIGS